MRHFDLIIVGGGLAGASLAAALRDTRLRIALVEQHPPVRAPGWDSRIYVVSPGSVAFLDAIGAWKHLDSTRLQRVDNMQVAGDQQGKIEFSAYDCGVDTLGWSIESSHLACELWEGIKRQSNLSLFCPAQPAALTIADDAAHLTLAGGETLSARLLVAADGRDSWIRRQAGLTAIDSPYGEQGVVANFACVREHRGTAWQWFRDDGILAWLPLPDQQFSMVWSTADAHAETLLALPPAEFCARVAAAGGQRLGPLELATPPVAFPLRLMRVPQTVAPRLALVGDAAHGIHPLSGHGINLGFADARELAHLLRTAPDWQDIGELRLLQTYQRARKEETLLLQTATDALHRLFRSQLPGLPGLRNFGLTLTNRLPIVKNLLVRYALGSL